MSDILHTWVLLQDGKVVGSTRIEEVAQAWDDQSYRTAKEVPRMTLQDGKVKCVKNIEFQS